MALTRQKELKRRLDHTILDQMDIPIAERKDVTSVFALAQRKMQNGASVKCVSILFQEVDDEC